MEATACGHLAYAHVMAMCCTEYTTVLLCAADDFEDEDEVPADVKKRLEALQRGGEGGSSQPKLD